MAYKTDIEIAQECQMKHIREIADFYDAVENDREPLVSAEEALKIQKLICEIYDKGHFEKG